MYSFKDFKEHVDLKPDGKYFINNILRARGYLEHMNEANVIARAYGIKSIFEGCNKIVYPGDLIIGSPWGIIAEASVAEYDRAEKITSSFGERDFLTNADHYAPNYERVLNLGIEGLIKQVEKSIEINGNIKSKENFLRAVKITLEAFSIMIKQYAICAKKVGLSEECAVLEKIAYKKPETFREAWQFVWMCYIAFKNEGRYAMAFGRLDQYLLPYYINDLKNGTLTREDAVEYFQRAFYKIHGEDVCNIAIGGVDSAGNDATNELSYIILDAVKNCNIPGPNLSARIHKKSPEEFLDTCLCVIGTGIGYPALMNDEVNIPALYRHGYTIEDARNYCMVGCIENFIPGKQPPWSDGRYNTPKYIELALNNGVCMLTEKQIGPQTGEPETFDTMEKFMSALKKQMIYGADEYMMLFNNYNNRLNPENFMSPFLSAFDDTCIERGRDINDGGTIYPSVHGAGDMGIATVSDSLCAIEKAVYIDGIITLPALRDTLKSNFNGQEELRQKLLKMPKYGNNDDLADKYAVWFVKIHDEIFSHYRTRDGGAVYTAIASNISNIPAGLEVCATPDGRKSGEPVSDAASPMHGMDKGGPTAVVNSLTKPDYTLVSCGSVVNQKYSPEMFKNIDKRKKLATLIRAYFDKGGQEIQINSISRKVLTDAMQNPTDYTSLVVRVSGFSAYYVGLSKEVQLDILERTEHE